MRILSKTVLAILVLFTYINQSSSQGRSLLSSTLESNRTRLSSAERKVITYFEQFLESEDSEYAFRLVRDFKDKNQTTLIQQVNENPFEASKLLEAIISEYKQHNMPIAAAQIQNRWFNKFQVNQVRNKDRFDEYFDMLQKFIDPATIENQVMQITGMSVDQLKRKVAAIDNTRFRERKVKEYLAKFEHNWKELKSRAANYIQKHFQHKARNAQDEIQKRVEAFVSNLTARH